MSVKFTNSNIKLSLMKSIRVLYFDTIQLRARVTKITVASKRIDIEVEDEIEVAYRVAAVGREREEA